MRKCKWTMMIRLRLRVRDRKFRERLTLALGALGAIVVIAVGTPEPLDVKERTHRDTVAIAADGLRSLRHIFRPATFR